MGKRKGGEKRVEFGRGGQRQAARQAGAVPKTGMRRASARERKDRRERTSEKESKCTDYG